jgi:hypothetical protein
MRNRTVLAALLVLATAASVAAKDLRTAFIRFVGESDWKPTAGQPLAVEVVSESAHEAAPEFIKTFDATLREQLGLVLKYTLDDKAPTKLRIVVQEFDPGNAAMRFAVGFGTGKSYVGGSVKVLEKGKEVGSFLYSSRPSNPGANLMAKQMAPGFALKLHKGERDPELHPMKAKA